MKNYKVIAIKFFKDSTEIDEKTGLKIERKVNDEFYCTKERYEYLKANNAVKLIGIQKTIDEVIEKEISEQEVQAVASAIVEEAEEQGKTVEEIVNEIVEETVDELVEEVVEEKPKKKKSSKKYQDLNKILIMTALGKKLMTILHFQKQILKL